MGNGQRVDTRSAHKIDTLIRVREQLVVRQLSGSAAAILLTRKPGLQRSETPQLALNRDADRVCDLSNFGRHLDVVLIRCRSLHVLAQRAVHHHAREAGAD